MAEPSNSVFVGSGLPSFISERHLKDHFKDLSDDISHIRLIRDKETKRFKGHCFITFRSQESAQLAVNKYNKSLLLGKFKLKVAFNKNPVLSESLSSPQDIGKKPQGRKRHTNKRTQQRSLKPVMAGQESQFQSFDSPEEEEDWPELSQPNEMLASTNYYDSATTYLSQHVYSMPYIPHDIQPLLSQPSITTDSQKGGTSMADNEASTAAYLSQPTTYSIPCSPPNVQPLLSQPLIPTNSQQEESWKKDMSTSNKEVPTTILDIEEPLPPPISLDPSLEVLSISADENSQAMLADFSVNSHENLPEMHERESSESDGVDQSRHSAIGKSPATVVVSNIHPTVTVENVLTLLQPYGTIVKHCLYYDSGQKSNQVTVMFSDVSSAFASCQVNGFEVAGQQIRVKLMDEFVCNPTTPSSLLCNANSPPVVSMSPEMIKIHPRRKAMSQHLYAYFMKDATQDIMTFNSGRGKHTFQSGNLYIEAPTSNMIDDFLNNVLVRYSETELPITREQWTELMANESNKFNALVSPFRTNPNVEIIPIQEPIPRVVFCGKTEAVNSAYEYFYSSFGKQIIVNSIKLEAFQKLYPEIDKKMLDKFQVILTFGTGIISLDGLTQNVHHARCELEQLLLQIQVGVLPPLEPILYLSFKRRISCLGSQVVIVDDSKGTRNVCCTTRETLQELLEISQSPYQREVRITSSTVQQDLSHNYSKDIKLIEQDHLIEITWAEQKAILRGFVKPDLNSAKSKLLSKVKILSKVKRPLQCPYPISAYIHYIFFKQEQSEETKAFVSSLKVKLTSQNEKIYIEGPDSSITEEEKKVINFFAPPELLYKAFSYDSDCRFISQIENTCLRDLHKQYQFTYLIARHSKCYPTPERSTTPDKVVCQRRHSSSSENETELGFTITMYSNNTTDFEQVCSVLQALNPHTEKFPIPLKTADHVMKIKSQLEKKHSVRIFVNKSEMGSVIIHGLRHNDITTCRETLEGSLFVSKKININRYKAIYLETKYSIEIEKYRKKCHKFSMPPPNESDNLSENCFILVIGKSSDVESICNDVEKLLENFSVEKFVITCPQFIVDAWKRRWSQVKDGLEEDHNVIINLSQSGGSQVGRRGSSQAKPALPPSKDIKVAMNFVIFGPNNDSVSEVRKIIEEKENGEVISKLIPIKKEYPSVSHPGLLVKSLQLDRFLVWLHFQGSNLCLSAPCTARTDLEEANLLIMNHLEKMSSKSDTLEYVDDVIGEILSSSCESILKEANAIAKYHKVKMHLNIKEKPVITFTLTGSQEGLDIVKPMVKEAIEKIEANIDICQLPVDHLKLPYLKTQEFKQFAAQIKKRHYVVIKQPSSAKVNKVILQTSLQLSFMHSLKLSIIEGDILSESVDAIVNAANEDLKHIGGLAKAILDAGGPSIQSESTRYVEKNGKVKPGNAVCLGAGMLPVKHVIHAVAPRWILGVKNVTTTLYNAFLYICKCADKHNLSSIAIPALGTGIFNVPVDICAQECFNALCYFCESMHSSSLSDVRLVLQSESIPSFKKYFQSLPGPHLPMTSSSTSLASPISSWAWLDDTHSYKPYDSQTDKILSQHYHLSPDVPCAIKVNDTKYEVDFQRMVQVNSITKFERKIKFCISGSSLVSPDATTNSSKSIKWYYKDDLQQWSPYHPQDSSQLERWYQAGHSSVGRLHIGKHVYSFDFTAMHQVNVASKNTRAIKRSSLESEERREVQWLFQNDELLFQPYSAEDSHQLELWYQSETSGELKIRKFSYSFDFTAMTQCNTRTGKVRNIKRSPNEEEVTPTIACKPHSPVIVTLRGPREGVDKTLTLLQAQLDSCLSNDQIKLLFSSRELEISLYKLATQHNIQLNIQPRKEGKVAVLYGVSHLVKDALSEMQKCLITHMETSSGTKVQKPKEWQPQNRTTELFNVPSHSTEHTRVVRKLTETMANVNIVSVQRVQNQYLWERFIHHKGMIEQKNGGQANEMELFHGTSNNDPQQIYDSEEGFDMRFSASGMWGQANYFAVNASYSNSYAYSLKNGQKQMFLAKVLTGASQTSPSNRSLRMPPERPYYVTAASTDVQLSQIRYDTVNGTTGGSTVYMTYDNLKAYPAYLITYEDRSSRFPFF